MYDHEHQILRSLAKEMQMTEEQVMFHSTARMTKHLKSIFDTTQTAFGRYSGLPTNIASANTYLLRYLSLQLTRAIKWLNGDLDLLAFVVRSTGELALWARFVNANEKNARRFLEDHQADGKELVEYGELATKGAELKSLPFMDEYFASLPKRLKLSRSTDVDNYVFKLTSKYIHPSAWLLTNLRKINGFTMERIILRLFLIKYATEVLAAMGY
jgi:hypothetical protein